MTGPRLRPFVAHADRSRITYRCGCINEILPPHDLLHCVHKCPEHSAMRRDPATLDEAYYRENGALDEGAPERYVGQLTEALGPIPRAPFPTALAIEIGCGASPYISALRAARWQYLGIDPSPWVAEWARREHHATVVTGDWKGFDPGARARLILAAHVFEHLDDAPAAIAKAARLLAPGGELWLIVPDDEDPCNPDHTFFFDERSLRSCLEAAGLVVERMAVRRYIEREQFIYCRARKPG